MCNHRANSHIPFFKLYDNNSETKIDKFYTDIKDLNSPDKTQTDFFLEKLANFMKKV